MILAVKRLINPNLPQLVLLLLLLLLVNQYRSIETLKYEGKTRECMYVSSSSNSIMQRFDDDKET
jgi:hypothetical protein